MTAPGTTLTSSCDVAIERGERWVKQLASHLGRKAEVEQRADDVLLRLAGGSCALSSDDAAVHFRAEAPDEDTLARVEQVVGGHFERFAAAHAVTATWTRG